MFSALSDNRGYLSLLSFFLHHIKTIMGRVSVLIHINVPAIRKFSFKLEREKKGIVKHINPQKLRKLPFH